MNKNDSLIAALKFAPLFGEIFPDIPDSAEKIISKNSFHLSRQFHSLP